MNKRQRKKARKKLEALLIERGNKLVMELNAQGGLPPVTIITKREDFQELIEVESPRIHGIIWGE